MGRFSADPGQRLRVALEQAACAEARIEEHLSGLAVTDGSDARRSLPEGVRPEGVQHGLETVPTNAEECLAFVGDHERIDPQYF
jgi:hypothetical protein